MELLHKTVISALRETLSPERFEAHLKATAEDEQARASRAAERAALLDRIPKLSAAETKLAKAIAIADDSDALVAELKSTQKERREAEARLNQLEGIEMDLRADAERGRAAPREVGRLVRGVDGG